MATKTPAHSRAVSSAVQSNVPKSTPRLLERFAAKYNVDAGKLSHTLKATAFKTGKNDPEVTDEQLMALVIVADQYNLNPFTKEIFAFPDTHKGGVTPIVGFDGWIRLMLTHPLYKRYQVRLPGQPWPGQDTEGNEGDDDDDGSTLPQWMECRLLLKDKDDPSAPPQWSTPIREYFNEVKRDTGPWKSHPRRMLRHKTIIQAIRATLGFSGLYDPDEAERIREAMVIDVTDRERKPATEAPRALNHDRAGLATLDQVTHIRDQLKEAQIDESDCTEQFEVKALEALSFEAVQAVLDWIKEHAKN